jgi:hypothetical protein
MALFEATRALWPANILLSENSNAANEVYASNEKTFLPNDNWRQLALWAFHQALVTHESRALAKGTPLSPHEVTFSEFDAQMRANLNGDDGWLEERAEYESS